MGACVSLSVSGWGCVRMSVLSTIEHYFYFAEKLEKDALVE